MLDLKILEKEPERIKKAVQNRGLEVDVDKIIALNQKRKALLQRIGKLREKRNKISKEIPKNPQLKSEALKIKEELKEKEKEFKEINQEFETLFFSLPNLPFDDVPVGKDDTENVVIKEWGEIPQFSFKPKDYLEIGEKLDIIDIQRASRVSGTRFGYLKNEAVLLEIAIIQFAFDNLTKKGFVPVVPPVMIKPEMMWKMGYLKKGKNDSFVGEEIYFLRDDDLVLVGTSEQSIGPMHTDQIFQERDLPKRYVAFSTCFRREAGSYGKDTKGILRVHQFDKIEMFSFTTPLRSKDEHLFFLEIEEELMQKLNLPYRVVRICTGDLSDTSASSFDIETYLPGQGKYRETHSTSNCTDYQARRLNIRYRKKDNKLEFVHTINGTVFAIGRILIAIIENYQQKDGTVLVPEVLRKYINFKKIGEGV